MVQTLERTPIREGQIRFKACVRCGGDMQLCRDWYGAYWNCLQCGWDKDVHTSPSPLPLASEDAAGRKRQGRPRMKPDNYRRKSL